MALVISFFPLIGPLGENTFLNARLVSFAGDGFDAIRRRRIFLRVSLHGCVGLTLLGGLRPLSDGLLRHSTYLVVWALCMRFPPSAGMGWIFVAGLHFRPMRSCSSFGLIAPPVYQTHFELLGPC